MDENNYFLKIFALNYNSSFLRNIVLFSYLNNEMVRNYLYLQWIILSTLRSPTKRHKKLLMIFNKNYYFFVRCDYCDYGQIDQFLSGNRPVIYGVAQF